MSLKDAIVNRFELANIVAAFVVVCGLLMAYETKNEAVFGAIVGGGVTWLWKVKPEKKEEPVE